MLEYLIQEDLFYVSFIMYLIFLVCHSLPLVLVGSRSIVQLKLFSKLSKNINNLRVSWYLKESIQSHLD